MASPVRVAINGYGVIGKRVADAVAAQDDMRLIGVADVMSDYRIRVAAERGFAIYAAVDDRAEAMRQAGVTVAGTLADLLDEADVVVDCTPKGIGAANKAVYEQAGVKAIFPGGEQHELAGFSFVAQVNYAQALDERWARCVSCNTTALCRVLHPLHRQGLIRRARGVLLRRATDPWESHDTGMINTAIPETMVPSHQGPDAQTVLAGLDITTMAAAGPYDLSHLHFLMVETTRPVSRDELRHALWEEPRVAFLQAGDGLVALNSTVELMRDLGRPRTDMWEAAVWEDTLGADEREAHLTMQVHNEAIAVPENIDAIRALTGIERDGARSIDKTNRTLGIVKSFLPATSGEARDHATMGQALAAERERHRRHGFKGAEEPTDPAT